MAEVAIASCGSNGRGSKVVHCVAWGSSEEMGGSGEDEEVVVADTVEQIVDVGRLKVDEVDEKCSSRRESEKMKRTCEN